MEISAAPIRWLTRPPLRAGSIWLRCPEQRHRDGYRLGRDDGFNAAGAASMEGNTIVLSAGFDIADSTSGPVAQASQGGTGSATLTIGGGTYSSNLAAFSTGSIGLTDPAANITMLSSAKLAAPQTSVHAAFGTIDVAGDLVVDADNIVAASGASRAAQVTVDAGAALKVGTNAGAIGANGDLLVSANDDLFGGAGAATLTVDDGAPVTVARNLGMSASASWNKAAALSNPGGIQTIGGQAALSESGGGTINVGGD